MGSKSSKKSGPSAYQLEQREKLAEEIERITLLNEERRRDKEAAKLASGNVAYSGGEGSGNYDGGALSGEKKKKGATLAGEGAQTFGSNENLGA